MATAVQIPAQTTLEEYLHTLYRPDCEYIDGQIEERNLGKWQHARLQWLIAATRLEVPNIPIFVDLQHLFARLDETA